MLSWTAKTSFLSSQKKRIPLVTSISAQNARHSRECSAGAMVTRILVRRRGSITPKGVRDSSTPSFGSCGSGLWHVMRAVVHVSSLIRLLHVDFGQNETGCTGCNDSPVAGSSPDPVMRSAFLVHFGGQRLCPLVASVVLLRNMRLNVVSQSVGQRPTMPVSEKGGGTFQFRFCGFPFEAGPTPECSIGHAHACMCLHRAHAFVQHRRRRHHLCANWKGISSGFSAGQRILRTELSIAQFLFASWRPTLQCESAVKSGPKVVEHEGISLCTRPDDYCVFA